MLRKAINKLKKASVYLINASELKRIPPHEYEEIKPSGTVKEAWLEVGKRLSEIMNYEKEREE